MNDLKFSSITPKRVLVGTLLVVAFVVLYSGLRTIMFGSGEFSLSSVGQGIVAPTMGIPSRGVPGTASMDKAAYMESEMGYGGGYANDRIASMPPVIIQPESPPSGEAKIVRNGTLSLLVKNVDDAATQITTIRTSLGGQPGNASFNDYRSGVRSGNITIWIPSERFDEAMSAIKKLAIRVENENTSIRDVSTQYVDLTARLKNLKSAETQYLEIMKRSGKISEVLEVTRELNNTRLQIEQTQGQLDYLSHQVALSSISITLLEEAVPGSATNEWRPISVIKEAAKDTLNDLTRFIDMLLIFVVKLPLLLLNIAFWFLIIWVLWKAAHYLYRRLRNMPPVV